MLVEVIVQNAEDAIQAERFGADRLELVSAMSEGGLTPSYGAVKGVLNSTKLPVQIMIRPHSYGFQYSEADWEIMKEDISMIQQLGGTGIVIGSLTAERTIDERLLERVIELAPELDITFHRAFDEVICQETAYRTLTKYKQHIKRILTSGGKDSCEEATAELKSLVAQAQKLEGPAILPGSGLTSKNISDIHQSVEATEYHFGSGVRIDQSFCNGLDEMKVAYIRSTLNE